MTFKELNFNAVFTTSMGTKQFRKVTDTHAVEVKDGNTVKVEPECKVIPA